MDKHQHTWSGDDDADGTLYSYCLNDGCEYAQVYGDLPTDACNGTVPAWVRPLVGGTDHGL